MSPELIFFRATGARLVLVLFINTHNVAKSWLLLLLSDNFIFIIYEEIQKVLNCPS